MRRVAVCCVATRLFHRALLYAALAACVACAGPTTVTSLPLRADGRVLQTLESTGSGKIQHVVWVVQENRSFDDMFMGYPGADTVSSGKDSNGNTILLKRISLKSRYEIDHSAYAMFTACELTLSGTQQTYAFRRRATRVIVPDHTGNIVRIYNLSDGTLYNKLTTDISLPFGTVVSP